MTDPLHVLQEIEQDRFFRDERKRWIFPRFHVYRVADSAVLRFGLNRYPHHVLGAQVIIGHRSIGVCWARLGRKADG